MLNLTVQQFGREWLGSGMQVGGRTSEVMVMSAAVQVRSSVWVGKM